MINGVLQMDQEHALQLYGWFTASLMFSQILGAILGDLLLGNKKALIIGCLIQSLGAFSFCIPNTFGLYVGFSLIVLGGGLCTPNIISNFGKVYLNKTKLLDAGFTIFYLAANLGAFTGVMTIAYIGNKYGWNLGFIAAGIVMLLSIIPLLLTKDTSPAETNTTGSTLNQRITKIIFALAIIGLFWSIYEIAGYRIFELQLTLSSISTLGIPQSIWSSLSTLLILPISIVVIVLWTWYYNSQFSKLMIGFIFGVISFGILFLIPEEPSSQHASIYFLSLLMLAISEMHIAPIVYSILTKYSNPKYLAILISLAFIPTRVFNFVFARFNENVYNNPILGLKIGIIVMTIVGIGLIWHVLRNKRNNYTNAY